ncbi:MAG: NYN domain-containing protein, partial [Pseudomonadota bacterium]
MPGFVLIDGYNLLHATGILARGIGPGTLERARMALLGFLAASLEPEQLPRTTVVFDAADHPPGLPREVEHRGLKVLFAAGYADADTLIEQLIRRDSAPRQLTVVSSDHRIQRPAR